jgi:predicted Fe-Mo cluster-binding NifX family protein
LVVDTETLAVKALSNTSVEAAHGAGIGAAQMIASEGVKALLTGSVGPNAYSALSAAGIEVYTGVSGTVKEAVEKLVKGELTRTTAPTVDGHHGLGGGRGGGGRRRV